MNIHLAYNSLKTRSLPNFKSKCCEFLSETTTENIFPSFLGCNFVNFNNYFNQCFFSNSYIGLSQNLY